MLIVMVKKETAKVQRQVENGEKLTIIGWEPCDSKEDKMQKGQDRYMYLHLVIFSLIVVAPRQYPPPAPSSYIPQLNTIRLPPHAAPQALYPRFYSHSSRASDLEDRTITQGRADEGGVEMEQNLG